jgi:hypothetical protein
VIEAIRKVVSSGKEYCCGFHFLERLAPHRLGIERNCKEKVAELFPSETELICGNDRFPQSSAKRTFEYVTFLTDLRHQL